MVWDGVTLFTEGTIYDPIVEQVRSRYKVGWLLEPEEHHPLMYQKAWEARHKFDFILTYKEEFLLADPDRFRFTVRGGTWIPKRLWGLYLKEKIPGSKVMLVSEKNVTLGHAVRHYIRTWIKDTAQPVLLCGPMDRVIGQNKFEVFAPAQFVVVVEPSRQKNMFGEHLLDAVALGCVPIYYGCPNIGDFLDEDGLLVAETPEKIKAHIQTADASVYQSKYPHLRNNLNHLLKYAVTEDYLATGPLKDIL